jgi:hypothetical protein
MQEEPTSRLSSDQVNFFGDITFALTNYGLRMNAMLAKQSSWTITSRGRADSQGTSVPSNFKEGAAICTSIHRDRKIDQKAGDMNI